MESIEFLLSHYASYRPRFPLVFEAILYLLHKKDVKDIDDLHFQMEQLIENLTKNDFHLLYNAMVDYEKLDFLSKVNYLLPKYIFPRSSKLLLNQALTDIAYHERDEEKNSQYQVLKYFFPFHDYYSLDPNMRCEIYYFIRMQLILCSSKQEMLHKLKYEEPFRRYIYESLLKDHKSKILNQKKFESDVRTVINYLVNYLEEDDDTNEKEFYRSWNYNGKMNNKFGINYQKIDIDN